MLHNHLFTLCDGRYTDVDQTNTVFKAQQFYLKCRVFQQVVLKDKSLLQVAHYT